jgi:hypothetical protein
MSGGETERRHVCVTESDVCKLIEIDRVGWCGARARGHPDKPRVYLGSSIELGTVGRLGRQ